MIHSKKGKITFLYVSQATWRLCSHRKELFKTSTQKIISFNCVMLWKHKRKIFHHSPFDFNCSHSNEPFCSTLEILFVTGLRFAACVFVSERGEAAAPPWTTTASFLFIYFLLLLSSAFSCWLIYFIHTCYLYITCNSLHSFEPCSTSFNLLLCFPLSSVWFISGTLCFF